MEEIKGLTAKFLNSVAVFIKWVLLASVVGSIVGVMGVLFHFAVEQATHLQTSYPWLLFLLPVGGAVILIVLSVLLTLLGGLIPSKKAAKSDPVTALRTE